MNPEHLQGILALADLQDDFVALDYKKFRDQNRVVLVLGHRDFHSLMDEFPSLRTRVLESLASKVRILDTAAVH